MYTCSVEQNTGLNQTRVALGRAHSSAEAADVSKQTTGNTIILPHRVWRYPRQTVTPTLLQP